jgi:hypothetical protein
MYETSVSDEPFPSRRELIGLRARAIRKRIWFKILDDGERALINCTIAVVKERVKSSRLARLLRFVVEKLTDAAPRFSELAIRIGRALIKRWMESSAPWYANLLREASEDPNFVFLQGVSYLNSPPVLRFWSMAELLKG